MRYAICALMLCGLIVVGCSNGDSDDPVAARPAPTVTAPKGELAIPTEIPERIEEFPAPQSPVDVSRESYDQLADNRFQAVAENPLSTFSIDVDTASYSNVRRYLTAGQLPPPGAVRIEELINYFTYDYPQPADGVPFSVNVEIASCPWKAEHRLVRIGLKGKELSREQRPVSSLVFLLDVSGSMQDYNKLPLLKNALSLLVDQLSENDRVAIVVYAGASGIVLDSTPANRKAEIMTAIGNLQAGGATHGSAGIDLAYQVATQNFIPKGTNRVILCTDGDFNVGITREDQLVQLIEDKAKRGIFLSVLGFGMGNLKDSTLEKLADKGNGNYAYIDTLAEARKVLVEQMQGTLITIAKDVKIQLEFNPSRALAYRLIGYENRVLANRDFHDDRKDAGEIGAGHTVTALYEVAPAGTSGALASIEPLNYQTNAIVQNPIRDSSGERNELLTLKLRYKQPDGDESQLLEFPVADSDRQFAKASPDFAWAAAVAAFGMILRDSEYKGTATLPAVLEIARSNRPSDQSGYREEFISLVELALRLKPGK